MELSGLYVPADASWLPDLRIELTQFPHGAHDDQCDMLGLAGQLLDKHVKARKPLPDPDEKLFDDYRTKTDVPAGQHQFHDDLNVQAVQGKHFGLHRCGSPARSGHQCTPGTRQRQHVLDA